MQSRRDHPKTLGGSSTRVLALLLISCLVQCATGSCLSYGHSCWGAHGKRSGKPPAAAPDWYLARLLRRVITDQDLTGARDTRDDGDRRAIYQADEDNKAENVQISDTDPMTLEQPNAKRYPGVAPAGLDYEALTRAKFIQMMRAASETDNK